MPPKPPPSPPALIVLSSVSALAAGWLAVALVEVCRGLFGLAAGVPLRRLDIGPPFYLLRAVQDGAPATPGGWLMVTFGGPVVLVVVAFAAAALAGMLRSKGWLKSGGLSLALLALAWVPTMLFAGALRRGGAGGPVGAMYQALGDPQAGRWAALGLALLVLWLVAAPASRRAVGTGRAWMRADAVMFRKRLVRVVAGYPLAVATIALVILQGWMSPIAALVWAVFVVVFLVIRTT